MYGISKSISAEEIKSFRGQFVLSQKEAADLFGVSYKTVQHWESGKVEVTGPIVLLIKLLSEDPRWVNRLKVPDRKLPLRLWYLYKNEPCTMIDVDENRRLISIKNFTNKVQFRAFGNNEEPSYEEYEEFLKSRCFPPTRDKMKLVLKELNLPFYDPFMIIKKTEGKMAEDDFRLKIEE